MDKVFEYFVNALDWIWSDMLFDDKEVKVYVESDKKNDKEKMVLGTLHFDN